MVKKLVLALLVAFAPIAQSQAASKAKVAESLSSIERHIKSGGVSAADINAATKVFNESMDAVAKDKDLLEQAFKVVKAYETSPTYGPLFINEATRSGISKKAIAGNEIHFAMAAIQQGLIDHAYTSENLAKFAKIMNNTKFETSSYFPGAVDAPKKATSYKAQVNASNRVSWGSPTSNENAFAKRPTGCYVAPGSIVRVKVPQSMVGKGFNVRVGAHSWDHDKRPTMKRLDRVSLVYPITSSETLIGSPLGGGIYIEIPYEIDLGVLEVEITNAVRSPYFSARSFDKTTNAEWESVERNNPAPWADFESDDFMMNLPTSWITKFKNPEQLMADWDTAMAAVFEVRGLNKDLFDKTLLFVQVDVQMRGGANFPGYPQTNYTYNPWDKENGDKKHWMLTGPLDADWTVLHELGHSTFITKFRGETEALVNFMHVIVQNKGFGVDLDRAFGSSVLGKDNLTKDDIAAMWMVTETFRQGKEMNYSNRPGDEFKYQHRGYGKYVEVVDLFGWDALSKFWRATDEDYMGAKKFYPVDRNREPVDSRIYNMSVAAGADLTPLIHYWGIHPVDAASLKRRIEKAGLKPSAKIYDQLQHYKTVIPMDNEAFRKHTLAVYPNGPRKSANNNPLFGDGWYLAQLDIYDTSHYEAAIQSLQAIINLYYPNGRPQ